jgi:hypothetical protein
VHQIFYALHAISVLYLCIWSSQCSRMNLLFENTFCFPSLLVYTFTYVKTLLELCLKIYVSSFPIGLQQHILPLAEGLSGVEIWRRMTSIWRKQTIAKKTYQKGIIIHKFNETSLMWPNARCTLCCVALATGFLFSRCWHSLLSCWFCIVTCGLVALVVAELYY